MNNQYTPFSKVYDAFLSKITDDMYMELTEMDTYRMLNDLLEAAIFKFEFPRVDLTQYELPYIFEESTYMGLESCYQDVRAYLYTGGYFTVSLTQEEINILSTYMIVEWIG